MTKNHNRLHYSFWLVMVCIVFSFSVPAPLAAQNVGDRWELVHRDPGLPFRSMASDGSGLLVAVGDLGLLMTSKDGQNWNTQNPGTNKNLYCVTYGNGLWVAAGYAGTLITSTNARDWTARNPAATSSLWAAAFNPDDNIFLVMGRNGDAATSPDGINWTARNTGTTKEFRSAVYGEGIFVAAASTGGIFTSSNNGVSWTQRTSGTINNLYAAVYGGGMFVVGGGKGSLLSSPTGTTWTKRDPGPGYFWDGVYVDGKFIMACSISIGEPSAPVYISSDGKTWKKVSTGSSSHLRAAAGHGSIACVGGDRRTVYFSDNTPAPDLTVFSPNGGEKWTVGETRTLSWKDSGPTNVKLEYSTNSGSTWTTIIDSTANDGSHAWTVPNAPSTTCRVRVSDAADGSPSDTSNVNFIIQSGTTPPPPSGSTITVTSPSSGDQWVGGESRTITWTGSTSFTGVDLEYYDGSGWNVIVSGTKDDGSYTWTVPSIDTSAAKIWIKGYDGSDNPTDYSDTFTIGQGTTIDIVTPNGGETLAGGNQYNITWNSSISYSSIDLEYYDGSSWNVIVSGTEDDGSYTWTVPNISTTGARLWIKGNDGSVNPTDYTDADFSIINALNGSITVTSPNGGETLSRGSTEAITWTSSGEVGNVKIDYSIDSGKNWSTIASSTANDGSHSWTLPSDVTSDDCLVKVSDTSEPLITDVSNTTFTIGGPPELILDKTRLNFGYILNGAAPQSQTVLISNAGGGTLNWSAAGDQSWIKLSPSSGRGSGYLAVSADPAGKGAGSYTGSISISDPNVSNSPLTITVSLTVKNGSQDTLPFGDFATPEDGLTGISGSVAVTGWVLDDIGVESVKIYREVDGANVPIGDAVFVEGARPDVELAYPDYPNSSKAGWGYMMLTNFLPEGQLILKAIAKDTSGNAVVLGSKTIYLDHENWVLPFGAIDFPAQGGEASGGSYRNDGWILTPQPNVVPKDGSTINVFIDTTFIGKATYNIYREDIAGFFPDYQNTNGSKAYFDFDTTVYATGVHTIQWSVTDSGGNTDGIGSRFFTIVNGSSGKQPQQAQSQERQITTTSLRESGRARILARAPGMMPDEYDNEPGRIITLKGYGGNESPTDVYAGEDGIIRMELAETERVVIRLGGRNYRGYSMVNGQRRPLPIGSTLDRSGGLFYWQAAQGFAGQHEFRFVSKDRDGRDVVKTIVVTITPGNK